MRLPYKTGTVRVSSPFGWRTLQGTREYHRGVDLVGSDKTLVSPVDGVVAVSTMLDKSTDTTLTWQWGNYVRIDGNDGRRYYLCHMAQRFVRPGKRVRAGEAVGIEGNTGYSFGTHCHLEVRDRAGNSLDPTQLLGIDNLAGKKVTVREETYAEKVCGKCGLEPQTRAYLDKYPYADELWRKLWEAMA